jgi:hypothetical protein
MKLRFKGKVPAAIKVVLALFVINSVAETWLFVTIRDRGRLAPDADYSHLVRLKGGVTYFVQPGLGTYLDAAVPLGFILLAVLLLLIWLYRDQLQRSR